jgi:tetratricopeptide (TPR) repeat protein
MRAALVFLILSTVLTSCVSNYQVKASTAHALFHRGRYEQAVKLIEKVDPARKDRLLHLLDYGMILHGAGHYEKSNKILTQAEELAEGLAAKSVSREVGATLWSEEGTEYAGDKYERVMIPVIRMLNYVMLDDWEGALVEVRRIQYQVERTYSVGHHFDNAFALYLSAIVWETLGQINDAFIDYRRISQSGKAVPYYARDMKDMNLILGLTAKYPSKGSLGWKTTPHYRKEDGQLMVIVESGRAPYFVSEYVTDGYFTISMPTLLIRTPVVQHATVSVDGKELGKTYSFYNIADDIVKALSDRRRRTFIRKMIKIPVQTGLYTASYELIEEDDTASKIAGISLAVLALTMSVSEKADERSWRTLPAQFQIGRFYLPPGKHNIEIEPSGGGLPIERTVEISGNRPAVLLARFPRSSGVGERVKTPEYARVRKAKEDERTLYKKVKANPSNGALKIRLAKAKMKRGDYGVVYLLEKGIEQGGSKREGTAALVAVYMVKGRYREASEIARKGKLLPFYAQSANYLRGTRKARPSGKGISLTNKENLTNALNHFIVALMLEKVRKYDDATIQFAKAYKYGLGGRTVAQKIMTNYKRADESFKRSPEGVESISEISNGFESKE